MIEGTSRACKDENEFEIPAARFIGEVSFVLDQTTSATVTLPKGGKYVCWNRAGLLSTLRRNPKLQHAFEALIGRDMAAKVAVSRPTQNALMHPAQAKS